MITVNYLNKGEGKVGVNYTLRSLSAAAAAARKTMSSG